MQKSITGSHQSNFIVDLLETSRMVTCHSDHIRGFPFFPPGFSQPSFRASLRKVGKTIELKNGYTIYNKAKWTEEPR